MSGLRKEYFEISPEEYLEGEKVSPVRHEYIDGVVYAMSGGTKNHNRIAGNIFGDLDEKLDGTPCEPFINDVKLKVKTLVSESYYYPDVVVSCDESDDDEYYVEKPTTIFEVLSESTERIDRTEKFLAYKSLPTLEEYVLVRQDRREVMVVRRKNDWALERLEGEFELDLSCGGVVIEGDRIYRNVDFAS